VIDIGGVTTVTNGPGQSMGQADLLVNAAQ